MQASQEPVLVIDPDPTSRQLISDALAGRGIQARSFAEAEKALAAALEQPPRLVLSELTLPDISGLGLCRLLREEAGTSHVPIVFVSGCSSEADRVLAFESGADDFVAKPFYASELGARVSAILKRRQPPEPRLGDAPVASDELVIDSRRRSIHVKGTATPLSATEFNLLELLASGAGRVFSRSELVERVWSGDKRPNERIIDTHVKAIRRKLGDAGGRIETVRGRGYRFDLTPRRT